MLLPYLPWPKSSFRGRNETLAYDDDLTTGLWLPVCRVTRSEPYDPYVPRGSNPSTGPARGGGPSKTAAIQAQIDDTVGIMKDNINKVTERQERLDDLQDKTGAFIRLPFLETVCEERHWIHDSAPRASRSGKDL